MRDAECAEAREVGHSRERRHRRVGGRSDHREELIDRAGAAILGVVGCHIREGHAILRWRCCGACHFRWYLPYLR
eukprot:7275520-Prymnesium_polylepis.1